MKKILLLSVLLLSGLVAKAQIVGVNELPKNYKISCTLENGSDSTEFSFTRHVTKTTDGDYIQYEGVGLYSTLFNIFHTEYRTDHILLTPLFKQLDPLNPLRNRDTMVLFSYFDSFENEETRFNYNVSVNFPVELQTIKESDRFEASISIFSSGESDEKFVFSGILSCYRYR